MSKKAKKPSRIQIIMLFILIAVTSVSLIMMSYIRLKLMDDLAQKEAGQSYTYHYVMIAEDIDSSFWQEAYAGARAAAKESDAVIELVGSAQFTSDQSITYLDRAIAARSDGIATCVTDPDGAANIIDKAVNRNIPVVTMEYDSPSSQRHSFIGVNSFNLGQTFGKLLASHEKSRDVVLLIGDDPERSNISENIILSGIQDYLENWPEINLSTVEVSRASAFSAEEAIRDLLLDQRPLDTILCLNVQDTLRCVEALVDFNQTDQVAVIGYQDNAAVLEYVKSGIIYSVISSDAWQIGYDSIKALNEIKTANRASEYIPSRLIVIDQDSVDSYISDRQEETQ